MFNPGQNTKSDWKDAFKSCTIGNLASFSAVMGKINQIKLSANFWLAVTRRWTQIKGKKNEGNMRHTSASCLISLYCCVPIRKSKTAYI